MVSYPPYFIEAGSDPLILILSIGIILILIGISVIIIESKCKNQNIKNILYLGLLLQLGVVIVDHFIMAFPTIILDPRAFERSGWYSYLFDVNIGRGEYNYWIINPIYKLLKIRVAIIFSVINIVFTILTNLNILECLTKLKIEKKLIKNLMVIVVLSPISIIMKAGIQREAIIIVFLSYSLKNFLDYSLKGTFSKMIKSFIFIGIAAIFHSGVIFLAIGYVFFLLSGKKSQTIKQIFIFLIAILGFILFKDQLLDKVGGGDINQIIKMNNMEFLKEAGSAYLTSVSTTSLIQIIIYLPLFIFYFLYSPTPDMFRGILDIITFVLNSSVFLYLTIGGYYFYKKNNKNLLKIERKISKVLCISLLATTIVFSIGTRNAGTAMRHRDKLIPFLIVSFAIVKNRNIREKDNEGIFDQVR